MPRQRKKAEREYLIITVCFKSQTVKEQFERGELFAGHVVDIELIAHSWSKRTAANQFYNACRLAKRNPLASRVLLVRGDETTTVWVDPLDRHC